MRAHRVLEKMSMENPPVEKTDVNTVADLLGQSGSKKIPEPKEESPKSETTELKAKEVSDK